MRKIASHRRTLFTLSQLTLYQRPLEVVVAAIFGEADVVGKRLGADQESLLLMGVEQVAP